MGLHSSLTEYEPSPGIVTTPRHPPPQLLVPGRRGFPLESRARFHIIAVRPQFSGPPINLNINEVNEMCLECTRELHTNYPYTTKIRGINID